MKDLMVKIKYYLYKRIKESGQMELHGADIFKTFSGRVSVFLQEMLGMAKSIGVRFDIRKYLKDNSPEKQLSLLIQASFNKDIYGQPPNLDGVNMDSFVHGYAKVENLTSYLNYLYIDILPKESISEEKKTFFEYVKRYLKGSAPNHKLSYKKQKEDFKKEIIDLAQHLNVKPFFFSVVNYYPKRVYTPYHTLIGLEEEGIIEINSLDRYGAIVTPLVLAENVNTKISIAYDPKKKAFDVNDQKIKLPGIYTQLLLSSLIYFSESSNNEYVSEMDIYEHWEYDVNETIEASKKLRIYHAARKINKTIAITIGIADAIQERKGFGSFRINPAINFSIAKE